MKKFVIEETKLTWGRALARAFFCLCMIIGFSPSISQAFNFGFGAFRPDEKVQAGSGGEKPDPASASISIGHDWNIFGVNFSPRLGYIQNQNNSDDNYGKYKVETFYVQYDFRKESLFNWDSLSLLYGFGSFSKRIQGGGRAVTIPNGSGTATAYEPGGTKETTSLSADLGLDFRWTSYGGTIQGYGLQSFVFALQPFNSQKRIYAISLQALVLF